MDIRPRVRSFLSATGVAWTATSPSPCERDRPSWRACPFYRPRMQQAASFKEEYAATSHGRCMQATVTRALRASPLHACNRPSSTRPPSHYGRLPPPSGKGLARPTCGRLLASKCTDGACKRRCVRALRVRTYACMHSSLTSGVSPRPTTEGRLLEPASLLRTIGVVVRTCTSVHARTHSFEVGVAVCTRTSVRAHTRSFASTVALRAPRPDCLPSVRGHGRPVPAGLTGSDGANQAVRRHAQAHVSSLAFLCA